MMRKVKSVEKLQFQMPFYVCDGHMRIWWILVLRKTIFLRFCCFMFLRMPLWVAVWTNFIDFIFGLVRGQILKIRFKYLWIFWILTEAFLRGLWVLHHLSSKQPWTFIFLKSNIRGLNKFSLMLEPWNFFLCTNIISLTFVCIGWKH